METIFNNLRNNMNSINALSCVEFSVDLSHLPRGNDPDWTSVAISYFDEALEELPFSIQELLPVDDLTNLKK